MVADAQLTRAPYLGLTPLMHRQALALVQASRGRVRLVSGYRTLQEQEALYAEAQRRYGEQNAAQWVADPQHSNHVKGSAADFAGDVSVLHSLAPQFGLVAPMSWEPWHLEMSSTRQHANPGAYTQPPPGETNPTVADFSQSPPHVAATIAEGLMGMGGNTLGTTGATGQALQDIINTLPDGSQAVAGAAQGAASTGGTTKGNVSPTQVYSALIAQGLPPTVAAAFTSIAGRESGFNTAAHNGNRGTGDDSYGLFQVNLLNGGWGPYLQQHGMSDPAAELTTLEGSAHAAALLYQSSGLHPWGGYKGMPWWYNVDTGVGASASGGAVTPEMMQALGGG